MGIDVLRYIDVVVGFSVVMLLASTVVTAITQASVRFCNLRGRNLRNGVVQLIAQIDPLLEPHAQGIAESVLKHRLVADPESVFGPCLRRVRDWWRGAAGLPAKAFPGRTDAERAAMAAAAQQKLQQAISADPVALLRGIRERSLELERNAPWLATHIRKTQAIIDAAANDAGSDIVGTATQFVGKVNAWFDESMDRVSQTFAQHTRVLTIAGAAIVALGLPLDSLDLLERLSIDDAFRTSMVERGKSIAQEQEKQARKDADRAKDGATAEPKTPEAFSLQLERDKVKQQQSPQLAIIPREWWIEHYFSTPCRETTELSSQDPPILTVADEAIPVTGNTVDAVSDAVNKSGAPLRAEVQPCDLGSWLTPTRKKGQYLVVRATAKPPLPTIELRDSRAEPNRLAPTLWFRPGVLSETLSRPGILLSVLLLSLGAPFWFEVLKTGLKLRPMLAGKEEGTRAAEEQPRRAFRCGGIRAGRTPGSTARRSARGCFRRKPQDPGVRDGRFERRRRQR